MIFKVSTKLLNKYLPAAIIGFHILLLANWSFTLWPEIIVYPYLLNNNFSLYTEIFNPYPPALIYLLSIFSSLTSYSITSFQIFTWVIILVIDILVYKISYILFKSLRRAVLSLLFFVLFSIPLAVNGIWFDLVQTPIILLFVFFLIKSLEEKQNKSLYLASILLAIGVFIKQSAALLYIPFIILLISNNTHWKKIVFKLISPLIILFGVHLLFFSYLGIVKSYIYWNFTFPLFEASSSPGYVLLPNGMQLLIILSLILIFIPLFNSKNYLIKNILLISPFLIFYLYPRFDYFHLIPFLALISLLFGMNVQAFKKSSNLIRLISIVGFVIIISFSLRYYLLNYGNTIRFFEPEIIEAARVLEKINTDSEDVYILNGPDQLLPLASLNPIKPWADEFPWYLENNNHQEKILASLKKENPKYIVFKPYENKGKYELGSYKPIKIVNHVFNNYEDTIQLTKTLWLKQRKSD